MEESTHPEVLKDYDVEKDGYFFIVARLEPENNTALLVEAFEGVKTDKKLVIVGDTNYRSKYLEDLKRNADDRRVRFLGSIYEPPEHLTELMCNCFAYVHGHMVGGTNPILLKALGGGACVLYADITFNAEVVQGSGIPFRPDVESARRALQDLVDRPDQVHQYRAAGPKRIEEAYTWDMAADRYEQLCYALHEKRSISHHL